MVHNGISFIVIGKNESWKISKCIESIFLTIAENSIHSYQIIFIDSGSIDDTIKRVESFENVEIYSLKGLKNAAIARNVGAGLASLNVLFFIDGDMELVPSTLGLLYSEEKGLIREFVSGDFENYFYLESGELAEIRKHHNLVEDRLMITTGGLFLIKKELWNAVGGMRNVFKKSQDLDLGIRLAKSGFKLFRIKQVLALHHTVSYNREDRLWSDLLSGNFLYTKPLLYRKNLGNKYMYALLKKEVSMFLLLIILLLAIVFGNPTYLLLYPAVVLFLKMLYKRNQIKGRFFSLYLRYMIFDFGTILGFMFFWPKPKMNSTHTKIK